jgi:hypothetical protein
MAFFAEGGFWDCDSSNISENARPSLGVHVC